MEGPDRHELERRSAQAIDRAMRAADAAVERRLGNGAHGDPVEEAAFDVLGAELTELERLERELSLDLGERDPLTIELGRAAGSLVALENDLGEGREIDGLGAGDLSPRVTSRSRVATRRRGWARSAALAAEPALGSQR